MSITGINLQPTVRHECSMVRRKLRFLILAQSGARQISWSMDSVLRRRRTYTTARKCLSSATGILTETRLTIATFRFKILRTRAHTTLIRSRWTTWWRMRVRPRGSLTWASRSRPAKSVPTMARLTAARPTVSVPDGKETLRPPMRTMCSSPTPMLTRNSSLSPSSNGTTRIPVIPLQSK